MPKRSMRRILHTVRAHYAVRNGNRPAVLHFTVSRFFVLDRLRLFKPPIPLSFLLSVKPPITGKLRRRRKLLLLSFSLLRPQLL